MKNILILLALIIFSNCNRMRYEQRLQQQGKIKCGWYGKMKTEEQRKVFPFNQAHKVLLISFPNYEVEGIYTFTLAKPQPIITPWGDTLKPAGYEPPVMKITRPILDTIQGLGRIYSIYEMVELNQTQIDSLSHLMLNYKQNKTLKFQTTSVSCCYKPRNAIIFLDKNNQPLLNFEICFECFITKVFPTQLNFTECTNFILYNDFFKQCHIHYGVDM